MKYLLMIRSSTERWAAMTDQERRALGQGTMAVGRQLTTEGRQLDGGGLPDESLSRVVRTGPDGDPVVTDGPYAETKEHLAGFLVVECESEAAAIAIAAQLPDAAINSVDVRPIDESGRTL